MAEVKVVDAAKFSNDWRKGLSLREQAFVEEYLIDLNATQALLRCGGKKATAAATASKLRNSPKVRAAIEMLFESRGVSKLRIIEEYSKVAFANIDDYVRIENGSVVITDSDKLTREQLSAISEITETVNEDGHVSIKVKPYDKVTALSWLGKAMRMFVERQEVSGPNGGPVQIDDAKSRLEKLIEGIADKAGVEAPAKEQGDGAGG